MAVTKRKISYVGITVVKDAKSDLTHFKKASKALCGADTDGGVGPGKHQLCTKCNAIFISTQVSNT